MRRLPRSILLVLLAAMVFTAFTTGPLPVSAAGGRYVLTEIVNMASEGYTYEDRQAMVKNYYENYIAQGQFFDYNVKNEDGLNATYIDHQMDGNLYPPHERIKSTFAATYTRPAFLDPGTGSTMTINLDYLLELTTTRATTAGSHGTMTATIYGGETTSTMSDLGGQTVTLGDQAKIAGTLFFKVGNTHKHIMIVVTASNFHAGGLGKGYHYELMTQPAQVSAAPFKASVLVNGVKVAFDAYNINNSNYFKLRDIGKALNFSVVWNAGAGQIEIDTNKPYQE